MEDNLTKFGGKVQIKALCLEAHSEEETAMITKNNWKDIQFYHFAGEARDAKETK